MTDNSFFVHLFRFYSKCIAAPYSELGLELLHIFRQLEVTCLDELNEQLAAHCLEILNYFQGEELSALQAEFTRIFSHVEGEKPLLSIRFTDYGDDKEVHEIMNKMYDSMLEVSYDESPDSIINFLDYYSYLSETGEISEALPAFTRIITPFSRRFYSVSNINFYKEVAKGLNELSVVFSAYSNS